MRNALFTFLAILLAHVSIAQQPETPTSIAQQPIAVMSLEGIHLQRGLDQYDKDAVKSLLALGIHFLVSESIDEELKLKMKDLVLGKPLENESGEVVIMLNDDSIFGQSDDDFGLLQFFIQMNHAALQTDAGQELTYEEMVFTTYDKLTNVLRDTKEGKRGFYWENYVPLYLDMQSQGLLLELAKRVDGLKERTQEAAQFINENKLSR